MINLLPEKLECFKGIFSMQNPNFKVRKFYHVQFFFLPKDQSVTNCANK